MEETINTKQVNSNLIIITPSISNSTYWITFTRCKLSELGTKCQNDPTNKGQKTAMFDTLGRCPFPTNFAARNGNLELLKWARAN